MADSISVGSPEIIVRLRRSARARRMTLRLSNATGIATLTLPKRANLTEARLFAERQQEWLRKNLAKRPVRCGVTSGQDCMRPGWDLAGHASAVAANAARVRRR